MEIQEISKKLEAIASPSRLKILCLLSLRAFCVCELAKILKLAQPTLTRHLQKLEEAGFVKSSRYKFYTIYTLDYKDNFNKTLMETLLPLLKNSSDFKKLINFPGIEEKPINFP
ncbi:MAG: ArsR/SmtB family transcription factor [Caldimicrobium sp.]